jgi:hypothetical protein
MGPKAAYMQQFEPRLRYPFRGGIPKKRGRQRPYGHPQQLAHSAEQRRIERQQHSIVRFCLQVGSKNIQRTLAMVQVTAHQQPWATPVAQAAQGLGAQQKRVGVVQQHPPGWQAGMD